MDDRLTTFLGAWSTRRIMGATLVVLGIVFIAYLLLTFYSVLIIVFVAFLLSTAVRPLVMGLQRFNIPPAIGVIIAYAVLLAGLIGVIILVLPMVINQVSAISDKIPGYYNDLRQMLIQSSSQILRNLALRLPVELPFFIDQGLTPQPTTEPNAPNIAVTQFFGLIKTIGGVLFIVIATLLLGFYWTLDGERTVRTLLNIIHPDRRESAREIVNEIQHKLGAYIRGQLILDLAVGTLATIAYFIIGLDYALILGILAGIMETVPLLGPILGAIPAALIALASGNMGDLVGVIVATSLIQLIENTFLVPRIMDRTVGINEIVTLLAFAAFSSILGLVGGLLAVPIAAIAQIIVARFVFEAASIPQPITNRDQIGVLRYEAQGLIEDLRSRNLDTNDEREDESEHLEDELESIVSDLDRLLVQVHQTQTEGGAA